VCVVVVVVVVVKSGYRDDISAATTL
jgi:hypothetical protein